MNRDRCTFYSDQESYQGIVQNIYKRHEYLGLSRDTDGFKYTSTKKVILNFSGAASYLLNKKIKFSNDEQINASTILGIELIGTTNQKNALTNPVTDLPQTQYSKGILVLVDNCKPAKEIVKIPLTTLCKSTNGNTISMFNISNIDWKSCYVRFTSAAALTAANSLQFTIYT